KREAAAKADASAIAPTPVPTAPAAPLAPAPVPVATNDPSATRNALLERMKVARATQVTQTGR
ncbi:MAG: hypothetical protein K8T89_03395, partial [Planctomycetes bacterium]|nr:hypothetical protein [Planctomycetota bacterium]